MINILLDDACCRATRIRKTPLYFLFLFKEETYELAQVVAKRSRKTGGLILPNNVAHYPYGTFTLQ